MINEVVEADCLQAMNQIPAGSVDLVLCDLPYGMTANPWDSIIPLEPLWSGYLRVCKPQAAIVLTASQPFTSALVMSQPHLFRHEWIWQKNRGSNFASTGRAPMKEHESVLVFSRGGWTYNKQMQSRTGAGADRAKYKVNFRTKSKNWREFEERDGETLSSLRVPSSWQKWNTATDGLHPTQKPVDMFRYFIRTYSNPGELVLDTCLGSGTTAVAAIIEGRRFIGIEKDPSYAACARSRIASSSEEFDDLI